MKYNKVLNALCEVVCRDIANLILSYAWPKKYEIINARYHKESFNVLRQMCYWGDWESAMEYIENDNKILRLAAVDACYSGYMDLTDKLISINRNDVTDIMEMIFDVACNYNKIFMIEYALERKNDFDIKKSILSACFYNCDDILSLLKDHGLGQKIFIPPWRYIIEHWSYEI